MKHGHESELLADLIEEAQRENFLLISLDPVKTDIRALELPDPYGYFMRPTDNFSVGTQIPLQYLARRYVPVKVKATDQDTRGKVTFNYQWSESYFDGQGDDRTWWRENFPRTFCTGNVLYGSLNIGADYSLVLEYGGDNKGTVVRNGEPCAVYSSRLKIDVLIKAYCPGAVVREEGKRFFAATDENDCDGEYTYLLDDTQEVIVCYAVTKVYPWL